MAKLLESKDFWERIYDRFPDMYKRDDAGTNYALKRFIESAGAGFEYVIDEVNGIVDLIDSSKTPIQFIENLYNSLGLEVFYGLPETFLRNLVPYINSMFALKGSTSAVEFMSNVVSGVKCELDTSNIEEHLIVRLVMDMNNSSRFPNLQQMERIVKEFIPFYLTTLIMYSYLFIEEIKLFPTDPDFADFISFYNGDETAITKFRELLSSDSIAFNSGVESIMPRFTHPDDSCMIGSTFCTLNSHFSLNDISGYDIIRKGDNTEYSYYTLGGIR